MKCGTICRDRFFLLLPLFHFSTLSLFLSLKIYARARFAPLITHKHTSTHRAGVRVVSVRLSVRPVTQCHTVPSHLERITKTVDPDAVDPSITGPDARSRGSIDGHTHSRTASDTTVKSDRRLALIIGARMHTHTHQQQKMLRVNYEEIRRKHDETHRLLSKIRNRRRRDDV